MPTFDDDALVLASYPYRDRDLVLALLARERGNLRAVLRGARGGKAPLSGSTQILSRIRFTAYQPPHAEMATVRHLELEQSSFPLASDLGKASAAAVVAELLATFCPQGEPAERPFRLGVAALEALLHTADPLLVVAYVEFWVLLLGGFMPPLDRCSRCATPTDRDIALGHDDGQPVCPSCRTGEDEVLDREALTFLVACRQLAVAEVSGPLPPVVAHWLDRRTRLEAERPLRALDFLRTHAVEQS
jgi:DNA repair protein RecO